jgi:hypothetical protein
VTMSHQDWVDFVWGIISAAVVFLAILYFLEYNGSLKQTHAAIWKKPKRWQLVTLCTLWGFTIVAFVLLIYFYHTG